MLRATVSLSRKISRDYNSTGYTVTLDGEVPHPTDDSEAVLEKVSQLFHLAEEALFVEIDRDQGDMAIGRRDEQPPTPAPPPPPPSTPSHTNGQPRNFDRSAPLPMNRPNYQQNGNGQANPDAATPRQLQFLLTMARRCKLNDRQLDSRISEVVGRPCTMEQLTKKEAGRVLDNLTGGNVRTGG